MDKAYDIAYPNWREMPPAQWTQHEERLRSLVVLHESAHCEQRLGVVSGINGAGNEFSRGLGVVLQLVQANAKAFPPSGSEQLRALVDERGADAKSLFTVAKDVLNGAVSEAELADGLARFELFADDLEALRKGEAAVAARLEVFNDHETLDTVRTVRSMVRHAARDPASLRAFAREAFDPDRVAVLAQNLALGSVLNDIERIRADMVAGALAEVRAQAKQFEIDHRSPSDAESDASIGLVRAQFAREIAALIAAPDVALEKPGEPSDSQWGHGPQLEAASQAARAAWERAAQTQDARHAGAKNGGVVSASFKAPSAVAQRVGSMLGVTAGPDRTATSEARPLPRP